MSNNHIVEGNIILNPDNTFQVKNSETENRCIVLSGSLLANIKKYVSTGDRVMVKGNCSNDLINVSELTFMRGKL